jgi:hypothetical protein
MTIFVVIVLWAVVLAAYTFATTILQIGPTIA